MSEYSTTITSAFGLPSMWSSAVTGFIPDATSVFFVGASPLSATLGESPLFTINNAPAITIAAIIIDNGTINLLSINNYL